VLYPLSYEGVGEDTRGYRREGRPTAEGRLTASQVRILDTGRESV
jgi:hypothetical protein